MAIQLDLNQSQYGIPFIGAYFRITAAMLSRNQFLNEKHQVVLDVAGYAAKPVSADTKEVDFRRYSIALQDIETQPGESFLAKCYSWLMSQPDMNSAVGV